MERLSNTLLILLFVFVPSVVVSAQIIDQVVGQSKPVPSRELQNKLKEVQKEKEKVCRELKPTVKRTYSFRDLSARHPFSPDGKVQLPDGLQAVFGPPPRYARLRRIIPFWRAPVDKYGKSVFAFRKNTGREIPVNESSRSRRFRTMFEQSIAARVADDSRAAAFDWRDPKHRVLFTEPYFQGWYCNNCWAHASVEAMQISRQIVRRRTGFDGDFDASFVTNPSSVIQTSACYAKAKDLDLSDACKFSWHSETLSFLVTDGLAVESGPSPVDDFSSGRRWQCQTTKSVRALSWDYVSAMPLEVAPTDEIKQALVMYGPIVSTIVTDDCLNLYGGGVFNQQHNSYADGKGGTKLINGDHIVLIVGWDDARGAWLVKNSWGPEWGDKGYGWIKYGSNNIGQFAAWILADPEK